MGNVMNRGKMLVIYNPVAGQEIISQALGEVAMSLQEKWDITLRPTLCKAHAEKIAYEEGAGYAVVVAAGGDGTIHEVVNGLMRLDHRPTLGILPAGTANDIARTLRIPLDLLAACQFMKQTEACAIDIGRYGKRHFVNFLGVGLISTVSNEVKNETKTYLRHFTYYLKSLQHFQGDNLFNVVLTTETEKIEKEAVMVYVANGQSIAGMELFTNNELNNGTFEVIVVENVGLSEIVSVMSSYLRREPFEHEAISRYKTASFTLECTPPQLIDTDGEKHGQTPVKVTLLPRALRVIGQISV
ncbi:diacylglycerol/lipid kinase family protein [Aneurinibacillus sp. REN35]|uniref:diacylglycerol/lipid kinase family protein n=1 Tax=Aneurinibacillus sp. REN35 TaxID=3237286 RepID=UPI0035279D90